MTEQCEPAMLGYIHRSVCNGTQTLLQFRDSLVPISEVLHGKHRVSIPLRSCFSASSQDHQVVAMHHLNPRQLSGLDFAGIESRYPARELGPVQIANPHDFATAELTFAPGDPGRQQALAALAQGPLGPVI